MTAAVWALLRSNGLARTRWAVAFGVFVALMALARTMAVAYIPGLALAALALILAREGDVRLRIRNLALAGAAAALVAGPWYVRNFSSVYDYLLNTGYGSEAVAYGHRYPFASSGRWSKELRLDLSYLSLPIAGALALCFGAGLALAVARPGRVRRLRTTSVPGLGSVVVTDGRGAMQQVLARNETDMTSARSRTRFPACIAAGCRSPAMLSAGCCAARMHEESRSISRWASTTTSFPTRGSFWQLSCGSAATCLSTTFVRSRMATPSRRIDTSSLRLDARMR